MKARIVVHMVNGVSVAGKVNNITDEEINAFKGSIGEIMESSGGWQINLESENGSWGIFPKDSVLWVELERME